MCEDWEGLSSKGWEKLETVKKGKKRLSYKTPLENGIRRVVNGPHQLKKHELKYVSILFPKSNLSKKRSIDLVEHNNETNETSIDMEPPVVSSLDSSSIFNQEHYLFFEFTKNTKACPMVRPLLNYEFPGWSTEIKNLNLDIPRYLMGM